MADTKAYMVGARALEQQMPSNRGGLFLFVFPEVVKIP